MNYEQISTSTEIVPLEDTPEQLEKRQNLGRKIGGATLNALKYLGTTGSIFGIVHTLDSSLPPQYSIPGAALGSGLLHLGSHIHEKQKSRTLANKSVQESLPTVDETPSTIDDTLDDTPDDE